MKKKILIIIMFFLIFTCLKEAHTNKKNFKFFSLKNMYLYGLGATVSINPYEPYEFSLRESKFSLILGGGFTLFSINDHFKINFEVEYINPKYDINVDLFVDVQKISFFNFMSTFEYIVRSHRTSFFAGIGISTIRYSEKMIFHKDSNIFMALNIGFKQKLSKNIAIRGEFKYILEPGEDEYDYYYEEYFLTRDPIAISSMFGIGIEFRFK